MRILIVAANGLEAEHLRRTFSSVDSIHIVQPCGMIAARRFDIIIRLPFHAFSPAERTVVDDWWSFAPTWLLPGGVILP